MKHWMIALIVIFIILGSIILSMALLPKVNMDFATEGKAIYKYEDKNISQTVSSDDLAVMCDLFNDKKLYSDSLSCGFSDNISIIINGTEKFCFACDSCPIVYWKNKDKFFKLSASEYDKLTKILYKYGFVFPCL